MPPTRSHSSLWGQARTNSYKCMLWPQVQAYMLQQSLHGRPVHVSRPDSLTVREELLLDL